MSAQTDSTMKIVKLYGVIGIAVVILSWTLAILNVGVIDMFFTPLAWSGYILVVDSVIFHLRGKSLIATQTRRFLWMLPISIICWFVFEAYNLHIQNWHYVNLPQSMVVRIFGYVWSFATIFPAIFLSTELFEIWGIFERIRIRPRKMSRTRLSAYFIFGLLCLIIPILLPAHLAKYSIAAVWVGFVFLLEPVNYILGGKNVLTELENGKLNILLSLFAGGLLCGIIWETWNNWAHTGWVYDLPYLSRPKIFEMPLAGFLGFIPFAVECFSMYNFTNVIFKKALRIFVKNISLRIN